MNGTERLSSGRLQPGGNSLPGSIPTDWRRKMTHSLLALTASALLVLALTQAGYAVQSNPRTNTAHVVCYNGHEVCCLVVKNKGGGTVSDTCVDRNGTSTTTY
jgi:hypothetical protein